MSTRSVQMIDWRRPINRASPLNKNLLCRFLSVGHQHSLTWQNLVKNEIKATRTSFVQGSTTNRPGGWGSAVFNGTSSQVYTISDPRSRLKTTGALSVFLWYRSGGDNNAQKAIVWDGGSLDGWFISVKDTGSWDELDTSFGSVTHSAGSKFVTGRWYHIGFTFDGSNWKNFINGLVDTSGSGGSISYPGFGAQAALIGGDSDQGYPTCHMDDICVWNRCLGTQEVQKLYLESRAFYPTVLKRQSRIAYFVPPVDPGGGGGDGSIACFAGIGGGLVGPRKLFVG